MALYFLSFHFQSFMQGERFSGRNNEIFFLSLNGKKYFKSNHKLRGQHGTPQEPKKGSKVVLFTDVRKKQQRHFIFSPDARQQRVCHQKKIRSHKHQKENACFRFEIRNDGIHSFSIVFFTRSCPCTCNSCLIIATTLILDGRELKDVIHKGVAHKGG